MTTDTAATLGHVQHIWRYPVKSMLGEELTDARVASNGLVGDRSFALVDSETGMAASAKNPKKWPLLFQFHSKLRNGAATNSSTVQITLPNGRVVDGDDPDLNQLLSNAVERTVALTPAGMVHGGSDSSVSAEGYWPDMAGLQHRDEVTKFNLPPGLFFDGGIVHLVTTATLEHLRTLHPSGEFDSMRFRPNFVIRTPPSMTGFVENDWIGQTVAIGEEVSLQITRPCGRCVMTTLPQGNLERDLGILKTSVDHNDGKVGVYAVVVRNGTVCRGDRVAVSSLGTDV